MPTIGNLGRYKGRPVFADAFTPEPGFTEPQEMNANAQKMSGLVLSSESVEEVDEQQRLQFCRRIHVRYDGDPEQKLTRTLKALLDTGSLHSLIFESRMTELDIHYVPCKEEKYLYSIEQRRFRVLGQREILFMYRQMTAIHAAIVYVLEDPPDGMQPNFDILLGREHLIPANAVRADYGIIGSSFHVANRPPAHL